MKKPEIIKGDLFVDDRGYVKFVNNFNFKDIKRFYQVENHTVGYIRAWHGHLKEGKYAYVASGAALFGVVDMDTEHISTFVLSSKMPKMLYIPPNNYNGFKNLEENTIIQFFSTTTLEESLGDDIRLPYKNWDIWNENFR